jgi:predicted  nucleic acid-binding Zn-ribbon protein
VGRKVKTVEQAVQILTELIISYGKDCGKPLKNGEALNAELSALVDAQVGSEDKISVLGEVQDRIDNQILALSEAQNRSEDKLQNINSALERLTQLVDKAHSRIEGLEN